MRDYITEANLRKALLLSAVITLMSTPRILVSGLDPTLLIPAAFLAMTFTGGTVTAWSHRAGLVGILPGKKIMLRGMAVALMLGVVSATVAVLWLDPIFYEAYVAIDKPSVLALQYPDTTRGILALVLWASSFEMMFFGAATVCFFVRLFNRLDITIAAVLTFRLAVACYQLTQTGVDPFFLMLSTYGMASLVVCLLFMRYGLPATMLFIAVANLRLFFI